MASAPIGDDDEPISGINVTPLVDVVLVLLIIFIVTASFLLKSAIPIELPKAATAQQRAQSLLSVSVSSAGDILINGRVDSLDGLEGAVRAAAEAKGGDVRTVEAFVSADVAARYGLFASVVDKLRLSGVTAIALDTRPESRAPEIAAPRDSPPGNVSPGPGRGSSNPTLPPLGRGEGEPR